MVEVGAVGQRCALPRPAKWAGGIISFAALVGFGTAAYLGKLDRKVALLGAGVSAVSLVVFGAIPRKVQLEETEENPPVPEVQLVTLAYSADLDTLQELLDAINGCEGLQVLDLSEMPDEEKFFEGGKLQLAIANHATLTKVKWGDKEVGIEKVDGWAYQLELNAPLNVLSSYLDRTDSILLPSLGEQFGLLPHLAQLENIKRVHLQKKDHETIRTRAKEKLWTGQALAAEERAFLKWLTVIDDNKEGWHFKSTAWNSNHFAALLSACPNLTELHFTTHGNMWTEERAQKVEELLDRGCTVSMKEPGYFVRENSGEPESARFRVAARLLSRLDPNKAEWTDALIDQLFPQFPDLKKVVIGKGYGQLFTRDMLTRLKAAGMKELKVIGNDTLSADDTLWIMNELELDEFIQEPVV